MFIAVDFDGTLVEHEFPKIGPEIPGAVQWLKRFKLLGADIILNTMRSDTNFHKNTPYLTAATDWCKERGIELFGVNHNPTQSYWTGSTKVYANIYIDDAAFGCPLVYRKNKEPYVNWEVVGPGVEQLLIARNYPEITD